MTGRQQLVPNPWSIYTGDFENCTFPNGVLKLWLYQKFSNKLGPGIQFLISASCLIPSRDSCPLSAELEWWHFKSAPLQVRGLFASQGYLLFTLAQQWSWQITSFSLPWARWSLSLRVMTRGTYSPDFLHLNSSVVLIRFIFLEKLSPNFSSASKSPGGLVKMIFLCLSLRVWA